jgi:hypothetical protein
MNIIMISKCLSFIFAQLSHRTTGGGAAVETFLDEDQARVVSLNVDQFKPLNNNVDDDASQYGDVEGTQISQWV